MLRELTDYEIKALHHELVMKDIRSMVEKLPPFPGIAWKVLALIEKKAAVGEVESVVKHSPAVAEKVMATSRYCQNGRPCRISSLHDAIAALTEEKLARVVITACGARYFQEKVSGYELNEHQLWQHSLMTAIIGDIIARRSRHDKAVHVYTASLLHDIGKTVLDHYAKIFLHSRLKQIRKKTMQSIDSERRALGIDHQELGAIITRGWGFPMEVIAGVGNHHCPQKAPVHQDIAEIVHAADGIATSMQKEGDSPPWMELQGDAVFRRLGIDVPAINAFQREALETMRTMKAFLTSGK